MILFGIISKYILHLEDKHRRSTSVQRRVLLTNDTYHCSYIFEGMIKQARDIKTEATYSVLLPSIISLFGPRGWCHLYWRSNRNCDWRNSSKTLMNCWLCYCQNDTWSLPPHL